MKAIAMKHHLKPYSSKVRTFSTIMFWIAFFMCSLMVYALGSWLPKLMIQAGYSLGASMLFLFALNIGGMVGAIGGGTLADKFHLKPVLSIMFTVGAIALVLLGFNSPQFVLYLLIAVAGAATIGLQILLYTFVAQFIQLQSVRRVWVGHQVLVVLVNCRACTDRGITPP